MPDFGTTIQNPNFHSSPDESHATIIETLRPGIRVEITGVLINRYWPVRLPDGRNGFIHLDLIVRDPSTDDAAQRTGRTLSRPNFHSQPDDRAETIIEGGLATGIGLLILGDRINHYWPVRLQDGRVGWIHEDLVAIIEPGNGPVRTGGGPRLGTVLGAASLLVGSPFDAAAVVTSSSMTPPPNDHHTPFGGNHACDMDVPGPSRGTPVRFKLGATDNREVSGRVVRVALACASQILNNGGRWVQMRIEQRVDGNWRDTGMEINYVHLDPVHVAPGDRVTDGQIIGLLGPANPLGLSPAQAAQFCGVNHPAGDPMLDEYHSSCAQHSHLHLEAKGCPGIAPVSNANFNLGREVLRFNL
jgi:hypothetical protein